MSETDISRAMRLAANCVPGVTVWRNSVGRRGRYRFGRVGSADLSGLIAPSGCRLEIEVKTLKGRLSDEQKAFGAMIRSNGGIYLVASDPREMLDELRRSIALLKETFQGPK